MKALQEEETPGGGPAHLNYTFNNTHSQSMMKSSLGGSQRNSK